MTQLVVGKGLSKDRAEVKVDLKIFNDNSLVLGAQGSGKSSLAHYLIPVLVQAGVSIVAIDTTGDLTETFRKLDGLSLSRGLAAVSAGGPPAEHGLGGVSLVSVDLGLAANLFSRQSQIRLPDDVWAREADSLVAALLELIGYRPRKNSRESAYLRALVSHCRSTGQEPSLAALPDLALAPRFRKLGAFLIDDVVPEDRRKDLSGALRGLVASPSFAYSPSPGLDLSRLVTTDGGAKATVISFADRASRDRQFILSILVAKLRTFLTGPNPPVLIWIDEAADFFGEEENSVAGKLLREALTAWEFDDTSFVFVAQNVSDLAPGMGEYCDTWFAGRTPAVSARREIVEELDLANPPVDEDVLDRSIRSLEPGQFILRSRWLNTLEKFEVPA